MPESTDKPEKAPEPPATDAKAATSGSGSVAEPSQQPAEIQIDDSKAVASYCNFCRVTGMPEELIIDFGLNPQPVGAPTDPVRISQRIISNYYTAKRLLHVLQITIERHEAAFGALEIDVQRRAQPGAMGQPQPPATR